MQWHSSNPSQPRHSFLHFSFALAKNLICRRIPEQDKIYLVSFSFDLCPMILHMFLQSLEFGSFVDYVFSMLTQNTTQPCICRWRRQFPALTLDDGNEQRVRRHVGWLVGLLVCSLDVQWYTNHSNHTTFVERFCLTEIKDKFGPEAWHHRSHLYLKP